MLEAEFNYFRKHQEELLQQYKDQYIVIVGNKVVGAYSSNEEALYSTRKTRELGTFLIQHCTEGESAYTYIFNSQVIYDYA